MGLSDLWKHQQKEGDTGNVRPLIEIPSEVQEGLAPPDDPMIGRIIAGRYEVESVLSQGGMGILYLAHHRSLPKKFVIKLIRMEGKNAKQREVYLNRFKREARAAAKVSHPNVVEIVDYNIMENETPYIVMECVEGLPLNEFLKSYSEGLPIEWFFSLMKQLCRAVEAIHQSGMIHRDLKPSNIMVRHDSEELHLKILDFGLVHLTQNDLDTNKIKLTAHGHMVGTPAYMSPEQCRGQAVRNTTDIYSLGLIAYEMLTAVPAVEGDEYLLIMGKQIKETPTGIQELRPDVPDEICRAIEKAIAKRAEERYVSAREFYKAIEIEQHQFTIGQTTHSKIHRHLLRGDTQDTRRRLSKWYLPALGVTLLMLIASLVYRHGLGSGKKDHQTTSTYWEQTFREQQVIPLQPQPMAKAPLIFIPERRALAMVYASGVVEMVDLNSGTVVNRFKPLDSDWLAVSADPRGRHLYLLGDDQCSMARVDLDTYQSRIINLCELTNHEPIMDMAHSPRLDRTAEEPDMALLTSTRLLFFKGRANSGWTRLGEVASEGRGSLHYAADGTSLAHFAADYQVRVYRMPSRGLILRETYAGSGQVLSAAFSPNQRYLACGTRGNQVLLFDLYNKDKKVFSDFESWVTFTQFLPADNETGLQLLAYSQAGEFMSLSIPDLTMTDSLAAQRKLPLTYQSGGLLALAQPPNQKLRIYRFKNPDQSQALSVLTGSVWDLAIRPDGQSAYLAGLDSKIGVVSLSQPKRMTPLDLHKDGVTRLAITRDGNRMLSASDDFHIGMWDLDTGANLHMVKAHEDLVNNIRISPDESYCISTSSDRAVKVWQLPFLKLEQTLAKMPDSSAGAAFSDSGALLAVGDWSGNLRLYDTAGFRQRWTRKVSAKGLYWLSFLPGEEHRMLVTTAGHETFLVDIAKDDIGIQPLGHQSRALGVTHAFSKWDDRNALAVFRDDRVQLFTYPGLHPIGNVIGLQGAQVGAFHPSQPRLFVGTSDGRMLQVDLARWPRWRN
ncbi:Non-specific serine/threonine protein kinase [Sulfidibacter corallicola]|uniref:Protein kinase n=1 Tax=Sulfidibacter corallicola TaxID=2818388 RepID=A0A8A4TF54_SULCO|nr:WD40 repeat domain-containing serine/threonine-protein kinase [Sulfidibacter corallicola]QTD48263.1 protein kinase [Sulfidibacter corallicola]